jgi:nucleotide-binding universal stress UspA family protein
MKVILAVPNGTAEDERVLRQAAILAGAEGGVVNVLFLRSDPREALPAIAEGLTADLIEELRQAMDHEDKERYRKASEAFRVVFKDGPAAVATEWIERTGYPTDAVVAMGRLSDVIVLGRPSKRQERPGEQAILEAALMETRRPVMLVPPGNEVLMEFKGAVIAWKDSPEATASVALALPILKRCARVAVVSVSEGRTPVEPPEMLARYLIHHGIKATARTSSAAGGTTEAALLKEVEAAGADLLVMGAYSRSRMRELLFGGVTEHMMTDAPVPVLLAH